MSLLLAFSTIVFPATPDDYLNGFAHETDQGVLAVTEHAFEEGVKNRDDGTAARRWFDAAARGYEELWQRGYRNPKLARNRARSHRLAGDLPRAIAALHDGLAVARYDRDLQVELEEARSAVSYPLDGALATECRTQTYRTIGSRMSPAEAFLITALLWLFVCFGLARFAMTLAPQWLLVTGTCLVCLAILGGFWWHDWRQQSRATARPLVIVKEDVVLRRGNGESFPPRLDSRLPPGIEARVLSTRGGWVQVELAAGTAGWLPEGAVLHAGGAH